jgi:hypothetical protein
MVDALFFDHIRALREEIRGREQKILEAKTSHP